MKTILIIFLLALSTSFSNEVINLDSLYKEGMTIYRNARASWLGNELLIKLLQQSGKDKALSGYFAYPKDNGNHFVFYDTTNKVIAEAFFDSTFKTPKTSVSLEVRDFNKEELPYFKIKQNVKERLSKDTTIRYYENTGINQIPIIYEGKMKCYLLTAPTQLGQVIYGNDYCIDFNKDFNITSITDLHKTIISIPYAKDTIQNKSYHTHTDEIGHLPTPTDIAITYLYGELAGWTDHFIQSSMISTKIDIETKKVQVSKIPNQQNNQNNSKNTENSNSVTPKQE